MRIFTILITFVITFAAYGGETIKNPVEVGDVQWGRDFDAALKESAATGKPVLILFQEIPGCSGVRKFGREVLTNPLLVEAMENQFVPLLVYNNRSDGMDHRLLKRYREPAWNYQVIRFLDSDGNDIIPRKDRVWTTKGVASRMIQALTAAKRSIPQSLKDLAKTG